MWEDAMVLGEKVPEKEILLIELNSLGYSARMKKIAVMGRGNHSEEYVDLLISLLENGAYEAHLALTGAEVICNTR